jgi:hypothetical protein
VVVLLLLFIFHFFYRTDNLVQRTELFQLLFFRREVSEFQASEKNGTGKFCYVNKGLLISLILHFVVVLIGCLIVFYFR